MLVLGIESSHDDTSIALVKDHFVIFNYTISQIEVHQQYGGTVPEIASREHYNNFFILLEKIKENYNLEEVDYIAYTEKPGLIGALQMGKLFAHALSSILNKPLISINHLEGHLFSVLLTNDPEEKRQIQFPSLALIISGGHTNLYYLKSAKEKELIGQSQDDAAGEVFDKVARTLNLGFPGGPIIDKIYFENRTKDFSQFHFTKPKTAGEFDFSFSGLKTQVINLVNKNSNLDKILLATAFEQNTIDYIIQVLKKAINIYQPQSLIVAGGVSANKYLREAVEKLMLNTYFPLREYSTDNGAMIAAAALEELKKEN